MAVITFIKNRQAIAYGILMAMLLLLLKWLEFKLLLVSHSLEIYTGAIALVFTALGIWLALKLRAPKIETVTVEKEVVVLAAPVSIPVPVTKAADCNISPRELEVLQLMADGLSNQEISERLFVSLNTVKTHVSRLFEKMEVKRRTQAVEKAKRLRIIG